MEGVGSVVVEFETGTNLDTALANVENAVDRVETLPENAETPVVNRLYFYESIGNIVVSGPFSEAALRAHAKDIRERLLAAGVDKVDLFGSRREEIWVEVGEGRLRQLNLTLGDIAARIGTSSADLPSGIVPAGTNKADPKPGPCQIGRGDRPGRDHRAREDGAKVHLRDIASVSEQFNERDAIAFRAGLPPPSSCKCGGRARPTRWSRRAYSNAFLEELRPTLPPTLVVEHYDDAAELIDDRINMLLRNGVSGLALVVLVLFILSEHTGRLLGHGRHPLSLCWPRSA